MRVSVRVKVEMEEETGRMRRRVSGERRTKGQEEEGKKEEKKRKEERNYM